MQYITCPTDRTYFASIIGARNAAENNECEDVVLIDEQNDIKMYGLADGQSGQSHCRDGGEKCLEEVFRYIAAREIADMRKHEHIDEMQYEIIKIIRDRIDKLSASANAKKTGYASTLMVFAYDAVTKDYVTIHLGDGAVIANNTDGDVKMISPPENGLTVNSTWLTTSREALSHLRIKFGSIKNYKRVVMITDGVSAIAYGKNLFLRSRRLINEGCGGILTLMQEQEKYPSNDDASIIVVEFGGDQT